MLEREMGLRCALILGSTRRARVGPRVAIIVCLTQGGSGVGSGYPIFWKVRSRINAEFSIFEMRPH